MNNGDQIRRSAAPHGAFHVSGECFAQSFMFVGWPFTVRTGILLRMLPAGPATRQARVFVKHSRDSSIASRYHAKFNYP